MNFFKRVFNRLKKDVKFSASNPHTFNEVWSLNTTGFRILSLSILFVVFVGVILIFILKSSFFQTYFNIDNQSIERVQLEKQSQEIEELSTKLLAQEDYIQNIKFILSGQLPTDFPIDSIDFVKDTIPLFTMDDEMTEEEKENLQKVKEDMMTQRNEDQSSNLLVYASPVKGVISQPFSEKNHKGIDVVTSKNEVIKSCLSGTVIYSGYTNKDGHIVIIEHRDGIISLYKHCERILKKSGDQVKINDPIAIVGNTGENTDGPHLHFELWQNLKAVNPADYIQFTQ